jgi:hypothetical protein
MCAYKERTLLIRIGLIYETGAERALLIRIGADPIPIQSATHSHLSFPTKSKRKKKWSHFKS